MRGRIEEARRLFATAPGRLDELGLTIARAIWECFAADAERAAGDAVAAERIARRALETRGRSAIGAMRSWPRSARRGAPRPGRDEEAERSARRQDVVERRRAHVAALAATTRAKMLARGGDAAAAEALTREAIELLETTDALVLRADTNLSLCEALLAAGDRPRPKRRRRRRRAIRGEGSDCARGQGGRTPRLGGGIV